MNDSSGRYGLFCLILSVWLCGFPGLSPAGSDEPHHFAPSYTEKNSELALKGEGIFKWMGVIKAYRGGLYLPEDMASERLFENTPKRLVLEYFHAIKAVDFYRATRKHIEKYSDKKTVEEIEPQLAKLGKTYRNVKPGDRYALTYIPGKGTSLCLNGELLGTFEGEAFARAMFSIWLGNHPIDKPFRDQLLGRK